MTYASSATGILVSYRAMFPLGNHGSASLRRARQPDNFQSDARSASVSRALHSMEQVGRLLMHPVLGMT